MKKKTCSLGWKQILAFFTVFAFISNVTLAATITVDNNGDAKDAGADGTCSIVLAQCSNGVDDDLDGFIDLAADAECSANNDNSEAVVGYQAVSGQCTFRAATEVAGVGDTIQFDSARTITNTDVEGSDYYTLSQDNLVVEGTLSSINGGDVALGGGSFNGLFMISGDGVTVNDLYIYNSAAAGVAVQGGANGTTLDGLVVGLEADGDINGNANTGIMVLGDNTEIANSTISGNDNEAGIVIWSDAGAGGTPQDIYIHDSEIGTDTTGLVDKGNTNDGIYVKLGTALSLNSAEAGSGIDLDADGTYSDGLIVKDNTISGNGQRGFRTNDSDGVLTGTIEIESNEIGIGSDGSTVTGLGNGQYGLEITGGDTITIKDNTVSNSGDNAIVLSGGTNIIITGNKIGTKSDGLTAAGNTGSAINISSSDISSVVIGGATAALGNVIAASGNTYGAIMIDSLLEVATVTIQGNYIGVGIDGMTVTGLGNAGNGITAYGGTITIGGDNELTTTAPGGSLGEGNVISNNGSVGISIWAGIASTLGDVKIYGNVIGLIKSAAGIYNTVDGNTLSGISIGAAGTSNATGSITIGATAAGGADTDTSRRNIISGNGNKGISMDPNVEEGGTVTVKNNYIGTDISGTVDLGNTGSGISVDGADNIQIGGTATADRNVISGNGGDGIIVENSFSAILNILGNYIGLDSSGTVDLGNTEMGIGAEGGTVNVGNGTAGSGNVISGNDEAGLDVQDGTVSVQGNYIGTDATGELALGNGYLASGGYNSGGMFIGGGTVTVGGSDLANANKRNVISGNYGGGIQVMSGTVVIDGNYIGTDKDGVSDVGNVLGSDPIPTIGGSGIMVFDSEGSSVNGMIIGGTTVGTNGNVISGNDTFGIGIRHIAGGAGQNWTGGYIKNNIIGFAADGVTAIRNGSYGIYVSDTAGESNITNLQIGGSVNSIETTNTYGIYLSEILTSALSGGYAWIPAHNTFSDPDMYSWQYLLAGVSSVTQCSDLVDNDSDGLTDFGSDTGCSSETDNLEYQSEADAAQGTGVALSISSNNNNNNSQVEAAPQTESETPTVDIVEDMIEDATEEPEVSTEPEEVVSEEAPDNYPTTEMVTEMVVESLSQEPGITDFEVDSVVHEFEVGGEGAAAEAAASGEVSAAMQVAVDSFNTAVFSGEALSLESATQLNEYVQETATAELTRTISEEGELTLNIDGEETTVSSVDEVEVVLSYAVSEQELADLRTKAAAENKTLVVIDDQSNVDGDPIPDMIELQKEYLSLWTDGLDGDYNDADKYFFGEDVNSEDDISERPELVTDYPRVFATPTPALWFAGKSGDTVEVVLVNADTVSADDLKALTLGAVNLASHNSADSGFEKINLGQITIDDKNKGVLVPDFDLDDGRYYVIAKGDSGIGQLTTMTVDTSKGVAAPEFVTFKEGARTDCEAEFSFDWLKFFAPKMDVNCSFVEEEKAAVIKLETPPGIVNVTWHSVILNSVIIADKSQGEVEITVPEDLPEGDHEAIVFVEDPLTGVKSDILRYIFTITR